MTGISQKVGKFSEQVWGVSMSVVIAAENRCTLRNRVEVDVFVWGHQASGP